MIDYNAYQELVKRFLSIFIIYIRKTKYKTTLIL